MNFFKTFLRTLAALAVSFATIAMLVDPRRELVGVGFPALQPNSRATKISMLADYRRGVRVTGFVLGSSRSMTLSPTSLQRATGESFFNLAVFSGKPEDFLALYRAAGEAQPDIKMLIVGVDPEGLDPTQPSEPELENNAQLMQSFRGAPFSALEWAGFVGHRLAGLYTIGYVRDVVVSVLAARHRPVSMYAFRADGAATYPKYDGELSAGMFSLEGPLLSCIGRGVTQLASMNRLDSRRLGQVRQLVTEARAHGVAIVLWAPPLHPRYEQAVDANPQAKANLQRALSAVAAIASATGVPFVDLSRPESYGADPAAWYDCIHFRASEADRVAARVAAALIASKAHGF